MDLEDRVAVCATVPHYLAAEREIARCSIAELETLIDRVTPCCHTRTQVQFVTRARQAIEQQRALDRHLHWLLERCIALGQWTATDPFATAVLERGQDIQSEGLDLAGFRLLTQASPTASCAICTAARCPHPRTQ